MNETVAPDTLEELRKKRRIAGFRTLLSYIVTLRDDDLHAANLKMDLTDEERAALALLLLRTFPADQAAAYVQAHFEGAGAPGVTLMDDPMPDARFWADGANSKELRAYACAAFEKMSKSTRQAFLKWAGAK